MLKKIIPSDCTKTKRPPLTLRSPNRLPIVSSVAVAADGKCSSAGELLWLRFVLVVEAAGEQGGTAMAKPWRESSQVLYCML